MGSGRRKVLITIAAFGVLFVWARWGPMDPLFQKPRSTVLLDQNGDLLGATVALDGQWRMPPSDSVPHRFETCLLAFEDRHFRSHPGIHLPSLIRAAKQNWHAGRIVSGGSTITMQVARMAHGDRPRTVWNKAVEICAALRYEVRFSKDSILALYAANAPFGGNVVGLEAAAWRWFGRSPDHLGWAECAALAVLPNAPARIHPARQRDALRDKRDRLLEYLRDTGVLDSMTCSLARAEPLPERPIDLPRSAPHALATLELSGHRGQRITSTLDPDLQRRVTAIADRHGPILRANEVHNAAVLILDVPSGKVLAYIGNLPQTSAEHAGEVDIIQARRSTGSLLKPFLYADMLQCGEMMPDQLVADLPTHYQGFSPKNFDARFDGAVPAAAALARSLNVPAVRALHRHGIERTLRMLRAMGLEHVDRTAENYGLSLIIGGAESTLWELTGAFASMARTVLVPSEVEPVHAPQLVEGEYASATSAVLSAASAYHTIQALHAVHRPGSESGWQYFADPKYIAWKSGTSFGHRDAWAIGFTDRFAVGVWTGNADGEGRPGHTGTLAAAPMLFDVFDLLPNGHGFDTPFDGMERTAVCRATGFRAGPDCLPVDTLWVIRESERTAPCPYHHRILVNATEDHQVGPDAHGHWVNWFSLPPAMEHYYRKVHPEYRPLPPAPSGPRETPMELIYPGPDARIHIPVQLDGTFAQVVLMAAHRDPSALLNWDLDGEFVGRTQSEHELVVDLVTGPHRLTLTDQQGLSLTATFHVVRSDTQQQNE